MNHSAYITWAEAQDAAGQMDPMGQSWTSWKLARYNPDGTAMRDASGHQIFETQTEYKARQSALPFGQTLELFA